MKDKNLLLNKFFINSAKSTDNAAEQYFIYEDILSSSEINKNFNRNFTKQYKNFLTLSSKSYAIFQENIDNDKKRRQVIFKENDVENDYKDLYEKVFKM